MPHPGEDQSVMVEGRPTTNYPGNISAFMDVQSQHFHQGTFEGGEPGITS